MKSHKAVNSQYGVNCLCLAHIDNIKICEIEYFDARCRNFMLVETKIVKLPYIIPAGINTLRPRKNGRYFPDDIFKLIFLNKNV